MKVRDLIELNAMITDLEITVRRDGGILLDQLNIGCSEGVKPPYPTRVPKEERFAGSLCEHNDKMYKDAAYIPKSINSWDDGKDYYQILMNRIPSKWLDLEVYSWEVWQASRVCTTSSRRSRASNFYGQLLRVVALPGGANLEIKESQPEAKENTLPGQMSIEDFIDKQEESNEDPGGQ